MFLFIIQNGSTTASFKYDSMDECLVAFHNELAWRADDRVSTVCLIIDAQGRVVKMDSYYKEVVTAPAEE